MWVAAWKLPGDTKISIRDNSEFCLFVFFAIYKFILISPFVTLHGRLHTYLIQIEFIGHYKEWCELLPIQILEHILFLYSPN